MELLQRPVLGDPVWLWFAAFATAAAVYVALNWTRSIVVRRLSSVAERTSTIVDDVAVASLRSTRPTFLLIVAAYAGTTLLRLPRAAGVDLGRILVIALFLQGAAWASRLAAAVVEHVLRRQDETDAASAMTVGVFSVLVRLTTWTAAILLILANLGVNVTALVAGLGVGSVAVALALQNILGDLFASLAIVLDRPFVIGDFINVDNFVGTVEHIGLKSTRIRSLDGELIVVSNADLLKSRIRNYQRMYERRVIFGFGVTYDTPADKLSSIPNIVEGIVSSLEGARFDRAHFKAFGGSSLDFEVVYYVRSADYKTYMDIQQAINLGLLRAFAAEGVEFAFPTRTVLVQDVRRAGEPAASAE